MDQVKATGEVRIEFIRDGVVVAKQVLENMVVTSGLNYIADRMKPSPSMPIMSHMAMGTDNTPTEKWYVALYAEIPGGRVALDSAPYQSANQTVYEATFQNGVGTSIVGELGIFNSASGGTMKCRVAFALQNKEAFTSFRVQWLVAYQ